MTSQSINGRAITVMAGVGLFGVALMSVSSAHAQVSISSDGVEFPDGTFLTTGIPGTYTIGDVGPAGGFVFYVTADGLHGLEAAPVDQGSAVEWGCFSRTVEVSGADGLALGTGESNTEDIKNRVSGCYNLTNAASVAVDPWRGVRRLQPPGIPPPRDGIKPSRHPGGIAAHRTPFEWFPRPPYKCQGES